MEIISITNEKIKNLKKLQSKKFRDETNNFIVEGFHLVEEALKVGILKEVYLLSNTDFNQEVPKTIVSEKVMEHITELSSIPTIIGLCEKSKLNNIGNKVLILDRIQDPGNLGTILRSASAFNIDTIIISDDSVDLYHPKVIRSTQGIFFNLNIITDNLYNILPVLKETHYLIGTNLNNGTDISKYQFPDKFALIMGNEGSGINIDFQELCNDFIYIKMNKGCESLNVAIATSIILYEINKR